jgi:hypothetical protein
MGDLGGLIELYSVILGVIFYRISNHSFILTAMKRLFLINTDDPELFKHQQDNIQKAPLPVPTGGFSSEQLSEVIKLR